MTRLVKTATLLFLVCLMCTAAFGAPFEPLFRVVKISGDCEVKPAGASEFIKAVEGKAYAYGTAVKTGRKSSALIQLSEGNECRLLAKAEVTMSDGTTDPKLKVINLVIGKIEIELEEGLTENTGNSLNVETATAVCGAIGTKFSCQAHKEQGVNVIVFIVTHGSIKIEGMNFLIAQVINGTALSMSGDDARSFTRIKTLKGSFEIKYKDSDNNPKIVSTEPDTIISIWRRRAKGGNLIIVTIIVTDPDSTVHPADTFTAQLPAGQSGRLPVDGEEPETTGPLVRIDEEGVITITTTTSTTTTTTQPASTTPIGRGRS